MMKTNVKRHGASLAKRNVEKFMRNRMAVIGMTMMLIIILACVCAPLLTPYDPNKIVPSERSLAPCAEHILGTDSAGRDIFARILYGGRISILIGIGCAVGSVVVGTILGCVSGYCGGKVDKVLVTVQELFSIFPQTLLVLLFVGFSGKSLANLFIIFIATSWPNTMRLVRTRIISLKQEPFVESCRANGISGFSIMFHHMLPNTLGTVIVQATLSVAGFILSEAGLSYLGMGVPDSMATWGNIINAAKRLDIIQNMPMLWLAPGIAIALFVLSVNFAGDGLREILDPSAQ